MIKFKKTTSAIILQYSPQDGSEWLYKKLNNHEIHNLQSTFLLKKKHLYRKTSYPSFDTSINFKIATKKGEYFKFNKKILSIEFDLYIHEDIPLKHRTFVAEKNVSIFRRLNELEPETIYIGGEKPGNLPKEDFLNLVKNFPNSTELKKYVLARVSATIRNYFETKVDGEEKFNNYMNKKESLIGNNLLATFNNNEIVKYSSTLEKLEFMLNNEISYNEHQWQEEIIQIILLLNPKYIKSFHEVTIKNIYTNDNRRLDFLLVDSSGNIDIVELKKPFDKCIVTTSTYRKNHIPLRELSGTVMQIEKYLFYLNKWSKTGEEYLTKKFKDELPNNLNIKITNPSGMIIMGREINLSPSQKRDFEVIKRKYKNIVDIITYDDLLGRLRVTIEQLQQRTTKQLSH